MKRVKLTQGKFAKVDDGDFKFLSQWKWQFAQGRATRSLHLGRPNGVKKSTTVLMHRVIMGAKKGQEIDHKNRDPLDNRRGNLRFVTHAQNMYNNRAQKIRRSKYPRITKKNGKWATKITKDKKWYSLGNFKTAKAAHEAVKQWSLKHHGEFSPYHRHEATR